MFDVLLSPALVYNYDLDLRQNEVALVLEHGQPLDEWLPVEGLSLNAVLSFGYINAGRPESDQGPSGQISEDYVYVQGALDLVYTYKDTVTLYAGPRFAANGHGPNNIAERNVNVWWGVGTTISF